MIDYKSKASEQQQGGNYVKPIFPRPFKIQCFRCHKRVHVAREYPNRRTNVSLRDGYKTEYEDEREGDRHDRKERALGIKNKGLMKGLIFPASWRRECL